MVDEEKADGPCVDRADSLRGWCDVIRRRFVALHISPQKSLDQGAVYTRQIGHLQAAAVASEPQTFTRTKRQTATPDEPDLFAVGVVESGRGFLEQDGRTCEVSGGAFAIYETSRPFTWAMSGDWRLCVYTWPRNLVDATEGQTQRLTARSISPGSGLGRFLGPMFGELIRCEAGLSVSAAAKLANELAELSIVAAGDSLAPECTDAGAAKLREIQLFIEQNLADPALTPDSVAREFYLSTRTLSRLFARSGLTVAAWIKQRRLESCREALVAPGNLSLSINEIAARHGFPNHPFFSREFAARYGMSPSSFRQAAAG